MSMICRLVVPVRSHTLGSVSSCQRLMRTNWLPEPRRAFLPMPPSRTRLSDWSSARWITSCSGCWLHATRDGARWRFDSKYFLLGNFGDEDEVHRLTRDLLLRAKEYLEGLLRPVAPAYRTVAYRAGGYGIQPRERAILRALVDAGYRIDFRSQPVQLLSLARRGPGAGSRPRCNRMR
jgi:hypothetical protein